MAFSQEQSIVPSAIGDFSVQLVDLIDPPEGEATQSASFEIQVLDADGRVMRLVRGDLSLHITPLQRQALMDFMDSLRDKAKTEVIGE